MGVLLKPLISLLTAVAKALIPVILEELKKHQQAEMVGGGQATSDAVNDSVRDQLP